MARGKLVNNLFAENLIIATRGAYFLTSVSKCSWFLSREYIVNPTNKGMRILMYSTNTSFLT